MATFSRTQLIGGLRFLEVYQADLNALHNNMKFMLFIKLLHKQLDGLEFKDTVTANRKIANEFYSRKMNDLYPEVFRIAQGVKQYGKQASAHISIYYAMFVLDET